MDFIILWLVRKLAKQKIVLSKIIMGALIGAMMMCIIVILPFKNYFFNVILGYLITSLLIIYMTFRPKSVRELIKLTILMYLIAVMLGGIMFSLYYYSFFGTALSEIIKGTYLGNIKVSFLILIGFVALIIFKLVSRTLSRSVAVHQNVMDIQISINQATIHVNGLLDTGNNLYDPITNNPVIIGECDLLKPVLTEKNFTQLIGMSNNLYDIKLLSEFSSLKLRLIPYSSIGNENGMLLGIVTDSVSIKNGNNYRNFKDVVIAIYNKKLSKDNSYQVLIHPELIKA